MGRKHVHFTTSVSAAPASLSLEEAQKPKAVNKMRDNVELLIWVDVRLSVQRGGHKWWESADGVISTAANPSGAVGLEWFKRVVRVADGSVVWSQRWSRHQWRSEIVSKRGPRKNVA